VRGLSARWATRYSVKNCWTSEAKDGGFGAVGLRTWHHRLRNERLEPTSGDCHQLRRCRKVPTGVARLRVPDVGGQRQHRLIDVDALRLPLCDAAYDEGVPQVMDAWRMMIAAVAPAQLLAQTDEDAMHLAVAKRQPMPSASRADKERGFGRSGLTRHVARPAVAPQRFGGARVHRHLARLAAVTDDLNMTHEAAQGCNAQQDRP